MLKQTLLLAAIAGLCACVAQPTRDHVATAKAPDSAIAALYTRLDADTQHYREAHATDGTQSAEAAQATAAAALDDLQAAANQCALVRGCESQRFFAAFDQLLRTQARVVVADDTKVDVPDAASAEAGESSPVIAALPQAGRSVALLKGHKLGDIITINDPMKVALELWLTQYRPNLMNAYENYEYLREQMWPDYKKAGLPEALLFGILAQESGGKVHAVSSSGASGPLQFMSATGARFGLGVVNGFDQRFDPNLATRANAAYINEQLGVFNDNLELAIAAYNGGEGAMRRLAARYPNSGFWDPKIYFSVSPETRNYVPLVLAAAWLFLHPERYNLSFPHIDTKSDHVALAVPASLDELTVCLGQSGNQDGWFRTLRNLNPQYDPRKQLDAGTRIDLPAMLVDTYAANCKQGQWVALAGDLHSAARPAPPPPKTYVVRSGDTLGAIARYHHCGNVHDLARGNHLKPPHYALRVGQTLRIDSCKR
ncbi:MAG: transglycosylase SLT domain-containing protein [Rudaea sp.]